MKITTAFPIMLVFAAASCTYTNKNTQPTENRNAIDSISEALDYQLANYPASQYRDVYKNFMQDFFGPGHILADTAASGKYLRHELAEDGPLSEAK